MFGFGVYFNVVTNGGGGAPATEIFTANTGVFGTGKYLTAPSDSSFNLGGGDFTLSTWLNFSAFQTVTNPIQYRWAGGGANVNSHILRYRKDTGKMQLVVTYTGSESNLVTFDWTWAPIVGTEYHIAVERTGADLKFMVNNVQVDATLNIGTNVIFDSPRDLWLGGSNSNDIYQESFIGELFGMGIYKKSGITPELYNEGTVPCYGILEQATKDACSIYVPDYNFTGFVGQELDDQSSFAHVITETGTIAFTGTAQIECLDDGLEIFTANVAQGDGSTGWLTTAYKPQYTNNFTIGCKVTFDTTGDLGTMINNSLRFTTGWQGFEFLRLANDTLQFSFGTGTGSDNTTITPAVTLGSEVSVIVERLSGVVNIYIDGSVTSGTGKETGDITYDSPRRFGVMASPLNDPTEQYYLDGSMHSVFVLNDVMTEDERLAYDANPTKCFGLLPQSLKDKLDASGNYWPLYNHTDFIGQETDDQTTNVDNLTVEGGVTYTATAQVLCEEYVPILPDSLSGLAVWVDGETGYTDKSGNSLTITNESTTINATAINGLGAFVFNGSTAISYGKQIVKPSSFTVFGLVRKDTNASNLYAFGSTDSGGATSNTWGTTLIKAGGVVNTQFGEGVDPLYWSGNTDASPVTSITEWYRVAIRYTSGNTFAEIFVNGTNEALTPALTGADDCTGTTYDYRLGQLGEFTGSRFQGEIAEHFIYTEAKTDQEIADLDTYLVDRYAL